MGKQLCARNICKSYKDVTVLEGLDLTIEPGKIYGLIGRNGAGKTTLLGILTGQNTLDSGSVTYGGEPVWENSAALADICFSREIGAGSGQAGFRAKFFFQAASCFYPRWDREYAARLIGEFGLDLKKNISQLSKGQTSMITIILALASRAPITILDEPVSGLDVVMREKFYRLLLEDYASTGRTFIISTHIIEEAASVFEDVIILDRGRIIENRPTEELIAEFAYVGGSDEAVDRAVRGLEVLSAEYLGRRKVCAVRGLRPGDIAGADVDVTPMNLQKVFVALCGHGDEQ